MYLSYISGATGPNLSYIVVGDEFFPLRNNMLRPYPGRNLSKEKCVFNYHLSRAHRIVENAFGIYTCFKVKSSILKIECHF